MVAEPISWHLLVIQSCMRGMTEAAYVCIGFSKLENFALLRRLLLWLPGCLSML
jgi:hypothetical protein